jgi:Tfp pilus assembly protein PilF
LERAIEADPNSARAFVARAWALENLGPEYNADAQAAYEKAVALDPSDPWALEGVGHQLEVDGNREEARRLYRKAIEVRAGSENPDVLEIVAWCHHRLGEEDAAERIYRQALEVAPGRGATRFDLALTLFMLGRDEEALAEAETALAGLESLEPEVRRATVQVALDDLEEVLMMYPELSTRTEVARARVEMEAALSRLPDP